MKKIIFFIVFGLPIFAGAQGFWTEITALPSESNDYVPLLSVPDEQTIWATTVAMDINAMTTVWHRSTDGGATWTQGNIETGSTTLGISAFWAVSADKAFVAMHSALLTELGGVWKTEDAGATWTKIPDLYQTFGVSFPNSIEFYDEQNGTITGDPQNGYFEIYNTSDSGQSWTRVAAENIPGPLGTTEFGYTHKTRTYSNKIWFQTNMGRIFSSPDSGVHWAVNPTPLQDFGGLNYFEFDFKNESDGIIVSNDHQCFDTLNSGVSWEPYFPPANTGLRNGTLCAIPETDGSYFIFGNHVDTEEKGSSYSTDDGVNWIDMNAADANPIIPVGVRFLNEDNAYAVGYYVG